jgi:hypothetical protein
MPKTLRRDVEKLGKSLAVAKKHRKGKDDKKALKRIEEWWVNGSESDGTLPPGAGRAMVSTTQAVDIINGGVKVNALVSHLNLNYRNQAYEIARSSHCDSQSSNQYRFIIHRGPETCYRYRPPSCRSLQPTGRSIRREGLRRKFLPNACRPHGWQDHLGRSLQLFVSPSL